jgi:hypothetical protein
MHDDSTATTLSDNAASAAPLVGKIAPQAGPAVAPQPVDGNGQAGKH